MIIESTADIRFMAEVTAKVDKAEPSRVHSSLASQIPVPNSYI
jgi:hypothetical protein